MTLNAIMDQIAAADLALQRVRFASGGRDHSVLVLIDEASVKMAELRSRFIEMQLAEANESIAQALRNLESRKGAP